MMCRLIFVMVMVFDFSVSAIGQETDKVLNDSMKLTSQELFVKGSEYYQRKEYEQSAVLYRKAADMENLDAICRLGYMHSLGYGVPLDSNEAVRLTRIAADKGFGKAEYNM